MWNARTSIQQSSFLPSGNIFQSLGRTCEVLLLMMLACCMASWAQNAHVAVPLESSSTANTAFNSPYGVAVDASGDVFVSDTKTGLYEIVAVNGAVNSNSAVVKMNAPGLTGTPEDVTVDSNGNPWVVYGGTTGYVIQYNKLGAVSTVYIYNYSGPIHVAADNAGNLFILSQTTIKSFPSYATITLDSPVTSPSSIAVDANDNLYIGDSVTGAIYEVPSSIALNGGTATPTPVTAPSSFVLPASLTVDSYGNLFVADSGPGGTAASTLYEVIAQNGAVSTSSVIQSVAKFNDARGVARDQHSNLYVTDVSSSGGAVYELPAQATNLGTLTVGAGTSATQNVTFFFDAATTVSSVQVLTQGAANLDFTNNSSATTCAAGNYVAGNSCTVSVKFQPLYAGLRQGAVVLADANGNALATGYVQGTGTGAQASILTGPTLVDNTLSRDAGSVTQAIIDDSGNVYTGDYDNGNVYKYVFNSGVVTKTTIANLQYGVYGLAIDGAGNVYVSGYSGTKAGFVAKLVPQSNGSYTATYLVTGMDSRLNSLAVDAGGVVYVLDSVSGASVVYQLVPTGGTYVMNSVGGPTDAYGIATDGNGNFFLSGNSTNIYKETLGTNGALTGSTLTVNGHSGGYLILAPPTAAGAIPISGQVEWYMLVPQADGSYTTSTLINIYNTPVTNTYNLFSSYAPVFNAAGSAAFMGSYGAVYKFDSTAPSINFGTHDVGYNANNPQWSATVTNIGNQTLTLPAPTTGTNPTIPADTDFVYDGNSTCPILTPSSSPGTLAAGAFCEYLFDAEFVNTGSLSSSVTLMDNSGSTSATAAQNISLTATSTAPTSLTVAANASSNVIAAGSTLQLYAMANFSDGGIYSINKASWQSLSPAIASVSSAGVVTGLTVGTATIQATYAGLVGTIQVTVGDDVPVAITAVSGTPQNGALNATFISPLVAQVTDSAGAAIPGVQVTFSAPSTGASATVLPATAITDSNGYATAYATANATVGSYNVTASVGNLNVSFALTNVVPSVFTVTTLTDDATGVASNCTDQSQSGATLDASCSLRDALAAVVALNASVAPTVNFATSTLGISASAPGTISLLTGGPLVATSNVNIVGPGANQLTLSGANSNGTPVEIMQVGDVNNYYLYTVYASLSGLTLSGGQGTSMNGSTVGGAILNLGSLTVNGCAFTGNSAMYGGAIYAFSMQSGSLTITNSTFNGNTASAAGGAIIVGFLPTTIANSTFTANSATTSGSGGAIEAYATVILANNTFSGNIAGTNADYDSPLSGAMTMSNNILLDSYAADIDNGGNITADSVGLAPLGNYGGTTQTMPPLPGSAAICGGTLANATAAGLTLDQRGNPRSATENGNVCVDAGAVQTDYTLTFSASPSGTQGIGAAFTPTPAVQLNDYNPLTQAAAPIAIPGATIYLSDSALALNNGSSVSQSTNQTGLATFSGLSISSTVTGDALIAVTTASNNVRASATSSLFNVGSVASLTLLPAAGQLPGTTVGVPYSQSFTASNGTAPYTYQLTSGALPTGMTFSTAGLLSGTPTTAGTYNLTVQVTDNNQLTASQAYSLTVGKGSATVAWVTQSESVTQGTSVSLSATVKATTGTPTGTVNFLEGTTILGSGSVGSNGTATASISGLAVGAHTITASYAGDGNFAATSTASSITVTVQSEGFQITATGSNGTVAVVKAGNAGAYQLQIAPTSGSTFPAAVTFSLTGLPTGATYSITPSSIAAGSSATSVTITVQTTATSAARHQGWPGKAALAFAVLPLMVIFQRRKLKKAAVLAVSFLLLVIVVLGMASCGNTAATIHSSSYNLQFTATSGSVQHSTALTLTVQ